jgi:hypothetical protein
MPSVDTPGTDVDVGAPVFALGAPMLCPDPEGGSCRSPAMEGGGY